MSDRVEATVDAYNDAVKQFYDEKKHYKHNEFFKNLAEFILKHPECYYEANQVMVESYIISRNFQEKLLKAQCRDTELCLSNFALSFEKNKSKKYQDAFSYVREKLVIWDKSFFCNWDWLLNRGNK